LRAHRLESQVALNRITQAIIQDARVLFSIRPDRQPVSLAMQVANAHIGAWFGRTGTGIDWGNERLRSRSRLALVVADLPGRWSNEFLSPECVPAELAARMNSFRLQPGPEVRFMNMPPAPLEFAFPENIPHRHRTRTLWQFVRAAGAWLLFLGLCGITWAASH
jgi:hypothetical protein